MKMVVCVKWMHECCKGEVTILVTKSEDESERRIDWVTE
jgi:hypothetical protein